jgi:hypothetical protein
LLPGLLPAPVLRSRAASRLAKVVACVAACALGISIASSVAAFQLTSIRPKRDASHRLWVELRLEEPIEPRVASSLGRGMPATLSLRAELWRRRNGWFDRLEHSVESSFRIRHDAGNDVWHLERPGTTSLEVNSLDSLSVLLERTLIPRRLEAAGDGAVLRGGGRVAEAARLERRGGGRRLALG